MFGFGKQKQQPTQNVKANDSLQNFLLKLGAHSKAGHGSYSNDLYLTRNWVQLNSLYRSNWLTKRIIDLPTNDMTREWLTLSSEKNPETIQKIEQFDKKLRTQFNFNQALKWAFLYGGGLLYMDFGKASDPSKPINSQSIGLGGLKALHVLERWRLSPNAQLVDDSTAPEFGEPINYTFEGTTIDRSRIIRIIPCPLPWIERYREMQWGESALEPVFNAVRKYDSLSDAVIELSFLANLRNISVDGLRDNIADGKLDSILETYAALSEFANISNISLLDKQDVFETHQYNFAGIADVMNTFMTEVAGAAEIPITKLWGEGIKGLNNTGEGDIRQYYDNIKTKQVSILQNAIEKYYRYAVPSAIGTMPEDFNFEFKNLWQVSDKEVADIVLKHAQADEIYLSTAVMSEQTIAAELRERGFYKNIPDDSLLKNVPEAGSVNAVKNADVPAEPEGEGSIKPETEGNLP